MLLIILMTMFKNKNVYANNYGILVHTYGYLSTLKQCHTFGGLEFAIALILKS